MLKKMLKITCAFALSLALLVGCSNGDPKTGGKKGGDSKEKVKLTMMMFEGGFGSDWVKKSAEEYSKENPNVTVEVLASPDIDQQLQPRVLAGDAPDIINPGPKFDIQGLIADGGILPLNDYVDTPAYKDKKAWKDTFLPGQFDLQKDGDTYGIPTIFSTGYVWWYDAKLFRDRGWEPPKTQEDLYKLKQEAAKEDISVFALAGKAPGYYFYGMYLPLVQRIGGVEAIEDGFNLKEGAWESDAFLKAAEEAAKMREQGLFLDGTMALTHTEAQTHFFQRKALFVMAGTWLEGEMQDVIPEDFELTALNHPAWPDGAKGEQQVAPVSSGWGGAWYVSKDSKHPDEAVDFLKYLSSKEVLAKMVADRGLPATVSGTEDSIKSDALRSALDVIDEAKGKTYTPTATNDTYPEFTNNLINQFQALMLGDISPKEFTSYAEKQAKKLRKDDSINKVEFEFKK